MPLYEYKCRECGHSLEERQKFADDPLTLCPNCDEQGLFRVVQAAGVVFKGSGFYINDSKGNKDNLTAPAKKKDDDSGSGSNGNEGKKSSNGTSDKTKSVSPKESTSAEKNAS